MEKSEQFIEAITTGNVPKIKELLGQDKSLIESRTERGESPFILAAYHKKPAVVDAILEMGFEMDFCEAVATGQTAKVEEMIVAEPDYNNSYSADGWTALQLAAYFGRADELDLLIGYGCDLDAKSKSKFGTGSTALHTAIAGKYDELVDILLAKGANPNVADATGSTPLHIVAAENNLELIELLLERHGDPSIKNNDGKTPLDIALDAGNTEAATLLREAQ